MDPTPSSPPDVIPPVVVHRQPHGDAPAPDGGRGSLVLVHGFTQTAACWAPVDAALRTAHDVVAVDAPGHGGSSGVEVDLVAGAAAIVAAAGAGTYVGYSMGGRFCLHVALGHPEAVDRLVLISATAGIDDPAQRDQRRAADAQLADRIGAIGVPAFVDEWLALPLFAGLSPERGHRQARLANTARGLASSLRLAGAGTQAPAWDRLDGLTMPVLVVAGERDPKFVALAERLTASIGTNAELAVVAAAGHTVHLEQPEAFLAVLLPWLERTAPAG